MIFIFSTDLGELHPVIGPERVPFAPVTPGWYILAGLVLMLLIAVVIIRYRSWKKRAYRRYAVRLLIRWIQPRLLDPTERPMAMIQLSELLKTVAMKTYSRPKVACLSGEQWTDFLSNSCKKADFTSPPGSLLADIQYRNPDQWMKMEQDEILELVGLVNVWIGGHHV